MGLRIASRVGLALAVWAAPASATSAAPQPAADHRAPAARRAGVPVAVEARLSAEGGVTRLAIDLSGRPTVEAALFEAPDRLVLDLPEVDFQVDPAVGRLPGEGVGVARGFRFGLFAPGRSRVVVDLAGPAALRRVEVASIAGGDASRLIVELAPSDPASFHAAARFPAEPQGAPAPAPAAGADPRPVVVIDPGHGGVDPGASGVGGAVEKDVVLLFGTALADRLGAGGRYRVVMTRRDDRFVSLGDRVRAARDAGAALLISVHADALGDGSVSGATVYTAADRASDAEAARVADSENASDAAAGLGGDGKASAGVADILADLTRRETRTFAHQYQRTLAGYWAKIARLNHNPERAAGFKVLQAPDVPSVLLELGYLSSAADVKSFNTPEWRARTVEAVSASVDRFFEARSGPAAPGPAAMR